MDWQLNTLLIFAHFSFYDYLLNHNRKLIQLIPRNLAPKDLHRWLQNSKNQPLIIDVREDQELDIAPFPFEVLHLPLSQFSLGKGELGERLKNKQSVVVICHSGIRSWNFATWLTEQGLVTEVWNLEGGIDAWSLQVDASVARY